MKRGNVRGEALKAPQMTHHDSTSPPRDGFQTSQDGTGGTETGPQNTGVEILTRGERGSCQGSGTEWSRGHKQQWALVVTGPCGTASLARADPDGTAGRDPDGAAGRTALQAGTQMVLQAGTQDTGDDPPAGGPGEDVSEGHPSETSHPGNGGAGQENPRRQGPQRETIHSQ